MKNPFVHIQQILNMSCEEALRTLKAEVGAEHLMLGLLRQEDSEVANILDELGADVDEIRDDINRSLGMVNANGEGAMPAKIPFGTLANIIIRSSIKEAATYDNTKTVEPRHLLLALLKQQDNGVAQLLESMGISYDSVASLVSADGGTAAAADGAATGTAPETAGQAAAEQEEAIRDDANDMLDPDEEPYDFEKAQKNMKRAGGTAPQQKKKAGTPIIDRYGHDLTKAAAEGKLDPVVGRDKEMRRVIEILGRRKKNNPVLIGEPGVGKSAIVEGIAQLIKSQKDMPLLAGKRLVGLDLTALVAGTKYRGQFEERIKGLMTEVENNPDIILFIDEIHTIIGAGGAEGTMDVANILKPALARGTIQCIGATTLDEYRNIEKDGALERRFQKVTVGASTPQETLQILHNIRDKYEQHHCVRYTEEALEQCVKLAERYLADRQFPDKAIDVMDEVGSRVHINNSAVPAEYLRLQEELNATIEKKQAAVSCQNFEMAATYRDAQAMCEQKIAQAKEQWQNGELGEYASVTEEDVCQVVSQMAGVPVQHVAESESRRLRQMADRLKGDVIGQDDAIAKVVKAIQRNRMGLRDPNHPIGVFMFLGPTGVGKTYLAKKLAEEMFSDANAIIRIDMSEYAEGFNTSRLIGSPPGYVGYNEGGQLTEKVRRKPYSIVLLDEIEKANDKVFNLLLQLLDEGRLTDGNGRLIDFRNTIVIMTSNAGTRQLKDFGKGVGFNAGRLGGNLPDEKDKEYARSVIQKSLEKQFAPEFLNRLDEIITFDQLTLDSVKRIIDLELKPLRKRIEEMGYSFCVSEKAKEQVASKGYDLQFGARPLKRAIQNYIEDLVCELLLEGSLHPGDTISIGKNAKREELTIKCIAHNKNS